ncbi:MAG: hypothetical protein GY851_06165 [bacterium]|nr:hypothetical protein [bacterium]
MRVSSKITAWGIACAVLLPGIVWFCASFLSGDGDEVTPPTTGETSGEPREERNPTFVLTKQVDEEEESEFLDVVEARVSGRVVGQDGAPIAGARIAPQLPPGTSKVSELLHGVKARAGVGLSNGEGLFSLKVFPAGYEYKVRVLAPGFVPLRLPIRIPREGLTDLEFVLRRASSVAGTVVDEGGTPLARMIVVAMDARSGITRSEATPTSRDGAFEIPGLTPDEYSLAVRYVPRGNGFERSRAVEFGDRDRPLVSLRLDDGEQRTGVKVVVEWDTSTRIHGVVSDSRRRPVRGANVWAESVRYGNRALGLAPVPSNERGEFRIDAVALGLGSPELRVTAVDVCCECIGYEPTRVKNVPVGATDVQIQLNEGRRGIIAGVVLDRALREPVVSARVMLVQTDCEWGERWNPDWSELFAGARAGSGGVDSSGRFVVSDVRAGTSAVLVYAPDYGVVRKEDIVVRSGETTEVELLLDGPGVLSVAVTYAGAMQGQSAEFSLNCWPADRPHAMPHYNDTLIQGFRTGRAEQVALREAGTHTLELPPGEYDVVVSTRFYGEGNFSVPASENYAVARAIISSGRVTPLQMTVGEGGTVRGHLNLREGEQRLYVYLTPGTEGLTLQELAKPRQLAPVWGGLQYLATSGPFVMNCVPQGTHTLTVVARCPDETLYVRGSETFSIQSGGLVTVDVP